MRAVRAVVALVVCLAVCFGAGAVGSIWSMESSGEWYRGLNKPDFQPPDDIFMPVWTALYLLMGISLWLVWLKAGWSWDLLMLFAAQLAFNALWSGFFFDLKDLLLAFFELCCLWVLIVATLISFWRVQPWAGVLLLPYLAWVTFAGYLNFTIWQLNP